MTSSLERLIREAREDLGKQASTSVDWGKVDRGLFARIKEENRAERAAGSGGRVAWTGGAMALSAAAVAALVVGRASEHRSLEAAAALADDFAGTVASIEGDGELLVDGKAAAPGLTLRLGDVMEARGGARATFERPGKATFVLERGSRATVERVQGALVLALERGGVEAQVVPVPRGEAFAVDIGHSRVAVHGTHLRVARQVEATGSAADARAPNLVTVDLTEGVISVGEAPRIGSTSGTLVTAPAHAEFAADDVQRTLRISHDPADVRTAIALGPPAQGRQSPPAPPTTPTTRAESGEARPGSALAVSPRAESHAATSSLATQSSSADPNAEAALAAAVRACLVERPSAANVTVSVTTTLHLGLRDDGSVRSARFDPPVAPDVNACAVQSIYKTRFAHGGAASIAIDFREPSSSAP
jgi:hypothetical protein